METREAASWSGAWCKTQTRQNTNASECSGKPCCLQQKEPQTMPGPLLCRRVRSKCDTPGNMRVRGKGSARGRGQGATPAGGRCTASQQAIHRVGNHLVGSAACKTRVGSVPRDLGRVSAVVPVPFNHRAVQQYMSGGQSDFVCVSARAMHTPWGVRADKRTKSRIYPRPFTSHCSLSRTVSRSEGRWPLSNWSRRPLQGHGWGQAPRPCRPSGGLAAQPA